MLAGTRRDAAAARGALALASRFSLAPLAGYTNLSFRLALRELGGWAWPPPTWSSPALLMGSRKSLELIQTEPATGPWPCKSTGADPPEMRAAAQWLESYGVSSIDINMGCPVHKVVRGGGGSALMCDPGRAVALVRTVVEAVRLPVTVKMRLGWDDDSWERPVSSRANSKRRRGGGDDPWPNPRPGLRRPRQPGRHPRRGRGG